jgi:exosortase/archaeosortase
MLISHFLFKISDVNKLALLTISPTTSVLAMIASSSVWGNYRRVWGYKKINYLCRGKMYDALIQFLARPFLSLQTCVMETKSYQDKELELIVLIKSRRSAAVVNAG